ncbi:MAG: sugar transferase [Betaproteobacteria bacterium]
MSTMTETIEFQKDFERTIGPDLPRQLSGYVGWKTFLDRVFALVMLLPGLPMIGVLVALVRLTSRGPGIYAQLRVGKDGRFYTMYKLRSMRIDAESGTGAVWSQPNDPRVTPLGRVLRTLHLDELPQLFNVLKGEMSLIGPRPERPEIVTVLARSIDGYKNRLAIRPGITGLAQLNLPPDTDLNSVRRKQVLDLEYIRTMGLSLDLRILASTLLRMFGLRGGAAVRLLGLERNVRLDKASVAEQPLVDERSVTTAGSDTVESRQITVETFSDQVVAPSCQSSYPKGGDGPSNGKSSGVSDRRRQIAVSRKPR